MKSFPWDRVINARRAIPILASITINLENKNKPPKEKKESLM
jgi:hypothetical protein